MIVAETEQEMNSEIFPFWESELGEPLTEKLRQSLRVLEILQIEKHVPAPRRSGRGRFPHNRQWLARAFVIKALYNAPNTKALREMLHTQPMLRRICGFPNRKSIPSKATFSRSFTVFAHDKLGDKVHLALVQTYIGNRLIGHVGRDSTEIIAREKPAKKPPKEPKPPRKRGRPKKGEPSPPPEPTRLERQLEQTASQALAEIPTQCDVG